MTGGGERALGLIPGRLEHLVRQTARRVRGRTQVRMGRLRRLTPLFENWGLDRGQPVDRHFIDAFVQRRQSAIRGAVMEIQYPEYSERYGDDITVSEIVDIDPANELTTRFADLGEPDSLPPEVYDCVIVTQTLQFVDSLDVAIANLWRSLKPGGTLLVTMPTVSKLEESLAATEAWRVTPFGLDMVLRRQCPDGDVEVEGYGNILVSVAFLHGLVTSDLRQRELDHFDPIFPTGACGRATKPAPS